jgi:hypothetical protein
MLLTSRHDWQTYITIELPCKVEPHQAENDADEGQYPCGDIHDERPSPWPPSRVDLPFKVKSGDKFPAIPGINESDQVDVRENSHVDPSTSMRNFNKMALSEGIFQPTPVRRRPDTNHILTMHTPRTASFMMEHRPSRAGAPWKVKGE